MEIQDFFLWKFQFCGNFSCGIEKNQNGNTGIKLNLLAKHNVSLSSELLGQSPM